MHSKDSRIPVGVVGASGYSGEVLVDLLLRHPLADLQIVSSRSHAGKALSTVMPRLGKRGRGLAFTDSDPEALAASPVSVFFLALPHGVASGFAAPLRRAGKRVIDLSADFRLGSAETYLAYYGSEHPEPSLLEEGRYALADWDPQGTWRDAGLIACPGCYPTSVLVPLLPLLADGIVGSDGIQVVSMSSVSGAGRKVAEDYLFCERNESVKPYGVPRHRHLSEIEEQLTAVAGGPVVIQFSPNLVPINRGILTTITLPDNGSTLAALKSCWERHYRDRPFVGLIDGFPDTAAVANTNRIDLSAVHDPRTRRFVIHSAEDNLVKGASGQAVQIFNLIHGFAETTGLL